MAPQRKRRTAKISYPKHLLNPTDLLHFVCDDGFLQDCKDIDLNEEDLEAIEYAIMAGGKGSPVIAGTGGLRKLRFAPARWKTGKSGAVRVLFVYFQEVWSVLLLGVYRKSELDNISNEAKAIYRRHIAEIEALIDARGRLC